MKLDQVLLNEASEWRDRMIRDEAKRLIEELIQMLRKNRDRRLFRPGYTKFVNEKTNDLWIEPEIVQKHMEPSEPLAFQFVFNGRRDGKATAPREMAFSSEHQNRHGVNIIRIIGLSDPRDHVDTNTPKTSDIGTLLIATIERLGQVKDMLFHEFIHYLDSIRWTEGFHKEEPIDPAVDMTGYINSPSELNAYYNQFVYVFNQAIRNGVYTQQELQDFEYIWNDMLDKEFPVLNKNMTPDTRKRLMKRFYNHWEDITG